MSGRWPEVDWALGKRETSLRKLVLLLVVCSLGLAGRAWAESEFWVAVGSFQSLEGAERARDSAAQTLAEGFVITPADTPTGYYFRVLAGPYLSRGTAQDVMLRAQQEGFDGAWLLAQQAGVSSYNSGTSSSFDGSYRSNLNTNSDSSYDRSYDRSYDTNSDSGSSLAPLPSSQTPNVGPEVQPERAPPPKLIEEAPESFRLNKLRRDAQARPPPDRPPPGSDEPSVVTSPVADQLAVDFPVGAPVTLTRFAHQDINITIDGKLSEAAWQQAVPFTDFFTIEPDSLKPGAHATDLRLVYTERGIYVGFDLEQPKETLVKWLSRRDEGRLNRDNVSITLDTSGEGRYGYWMSLALGDNQTDGTLLPERRFSVDWDGAWYGSTSETDTGWSAEYFIPWSQMAMPKQAGIRRMGFYASRKVAVLDERWATPALPETRAQFISALQPILLNDVNPKQQWSVYPSLLTTVDEVDDETRYAAGAEIFWRPSTNFQASVSLNPDFGNVEADDVVVNLSAFEVFFQERRLFFLEGQEIFNTSPRADPSASSVPTTLVNTRRIGGRPREPNLAAGISVPGAELRQPTELMGAAKVTGQIGSLRYGVMGAFEDEVKFDVGDLNYHQDGSDYAAARVIYEDRQNQAYRALGMIATAVTHPERDAYVLGTDLHYLSANGTWKVDGQLLYSDIEDVNDPDADGKGYGGFVDMVYTQRRGLRYKVGFSSFSDELDINDFGFLRRNDAHNLSLGLDWVGVGRGWIRNYSISPFFQYELNGDNDMTRLGMGVRTKLTLPSLSKVDIETTFFPKRFEDRNSFGNGTYRIQERPRLSLGYATNEADSVSYSISATYMGEDAGGEFYQGKLGVNWRPIDRMNLGATVSYMNRKGWLLHQEGANFTAFDADFWQPQLDLEFFLSAKQQFRIAMQWVGVRADEAEFYEVPISAGSLSRVAKPSGPSDDFELSQLSFQVRYRWQIAPLSDLFVVYSKNGIRSPGEDELSDLFRSVWDQPDTEQLVVKLRYRLGT